jgi:SAM-dependent methyltransferase
VFSVSSVVILVTDSLSPPDLADVVLLLFGREPTRDEEQAYAGRGVAATVDALLATDEFRAKHRALVAVNASLVDAAPHEGALAALGPAGRYVDLLYVCLFGRPADASGRAHYVWALDRGDTRVSVLRSIVRSDEFQQRYAQAVPFVPRDVQLCELANPAKWDNPDWMALLQEMRIPAIEKTKMHRKGYEFGQLGFGLDRLGLLRDDARVLSVGAGHEEILYWFANRVGAIVGVDMYGAAWQEESRALEGDAAVLKTPEIYAPFAYRRERLRLMKMDGRRLGFAGGTFDVAYSLSSVEHFGGLSGAIAAVDEMARVVRPGGVVAVATEYLIGGAPHDEVFDSAQIRELFDRPGLRLVEPIDEQVYRRYEYVPISLDRNPYQTPHMVVKMGETVFTSVMAFLRRTA